MVIKVINQGPKSKLQSQYNSLGSLQNLIATIIMTASVLFVNNFLRYQKSLHSYDCDCNLKPILYYI